MNRILTWAFVVGIALLGSVVVALYLAAAGAFDDLLPGTRDHIVWTSTLNCMLGAGLVVVAFNFWDAGR